MKQYLIVKNWHKWQKLEDGKGTPPWVMDWVRKDEDQMDLTVFESNMMDRIRRLRGRGPIEFDPEKVMLLLYQTFVGRRDHNNATRAVLSLIKKGYLTVASEDIPPTTADDDSMPLTTAPDCLTTAPVPLSSGSPLESRTSFPQRQSTETEKTTTTSSPEKPEPDDSRIQETAYMRAQREKREGVKPSPVEKSDPTPRSGLDILLAACPTDRLRRAVRWLYKNNPWYKERLSPDMISRQGEALCDKCPPDALQPKTEWRPDPSCSKCKGIGSTVLRIPGTRKVGGLPGWDVLPINDMIQCECWTQREIA